MFTARQALIIGGALFTIIALTFLFVPDVDRAIEVEPSTLEESESQTPQVNTPEQSISLSAEPNATAYQRCFTPEQMETHPMLVAAVEPFLPLFAGGPMIEPYRGLNRSELLPLAEQGDTAAMTVLGAMAIMRARDQPESRAIDFLNPAAGSISSWKSSKSESTLREYEIAYGWFYEAAMHGRIFALMFAGVALNDIESSPVKRGLITQEDFYALTKLQQSALSMSNIYSSSINYVAGNPTDGFLGDILGFVRQSGPLGALAAVVAQNFHANVRELGLPPIELPESNAALWEEVIALLCEQYRSTGAKE